ncbi:DUF6134 family protein [Aestuariibaculum lutulentum]|uniref:DUF3108 domain-containing protein n=1 Tax=Aestuariibaculum lutulentum TaxID=2920935 RepID=A0ABS9RKY2_9FLAO|nr:DUF6134 family protein [Aestuariibaculum lutulentum]MCH4553614.1 hypothetical protein [Aestuariibaculum lutulentum]
MIPALILYLIRRMKYGTDTSLDLSKFREMVLKIKSILFFFIISTSFAYNTINTGETITYKIVKKNTTIGFIKIEKQVTSNVTTYILKSNVEVNFLVNVSVLCDEKSIYKNDILVYSSVYRKVNGKVKANHKLLRESGRYALLYENKKKLLELDELTQNLVTLYFEEPKTIRKVYCDNLKQEIVITPLNEGCYRVDFEKGKYNVFHYRNGECVKIDAVSKLFNVTLIPVSS